MRNLIVPLIVFITTCVVRADPPDIIILPALEITLPKPPPLLDAPQLNGTYRGIICVTEGINYTSFPTPQFSARLVGSFTDGKLRLQAPPGSTLLATLDEGTFASLRIGATQPHGYYDAVARNGTGTFNIEPKGKLHLTFFLQRPRRDFADNDKSLGGFIAISIDLIRTNN